MRLSGHSSLLLVRRVLIVWAIEGLTLWLLAQVLPGLQLEGWHTAIWGVAAIALLNALVRPLLLFLTLPFTVLSFGFLTIALNAFILILAARVVPGLHLTNPVSAVLAALGLAATNTLIASLLSLNDEDSFYRNVVRRIVGRSAPAPENATPGLIMVEIDGLSAPVLAHAMRDGYMPFLKGWLEAGSHTCTEWDCGLPSQTSSSQAGILYGNNFDIPAFRWYDKDRGALVVSSHPADARLIEEQVAAESRGLLADNGVSIGNLLSGGAPRWAATVSTYYDPRRVRRTSPMFFNYFVNPYNFTRAFILMLWEVVVEWWEGFRQRIKGVEPRVSRGGSFPFLRAASTVFTRELSVYLLMAEMFAGVSVAYTTLVGYDVVAHHAGPFRSDALRILRDLDRRIKTLHRAAKDAPRPYHFVILSDHGQSHGTPFHQRYGTTLEALVRSLVSDDQAVHASIGENEGRGWGHLSMLLTEAIQYERAGGRYARRIFRRRTRDGFVEVGPSRHDDPRPESANVVVCASGNLGLIYFTDEPGRVDFETVAARHPRLIEGLVEHPGIDFVMANSAEHGPIVMGKAGVRYLKENRVRGIDPVHHLGPNAVAHLQRLESFPHTGDLVVNGRCDPGTGDVVAFEDLVGSHGGLGGPQTQPFLMYPAGWSIGTSPIRNSTDVYHVLRAWLDHLGDDQSTQIAE